jgi:YD repeat-containing protein
LNAAGAITYDQTLSWNSLGEVESVTTNGITTTFGYDGWGRRVRKTTGGATTGYVWDGDDLALELDGAGALVRAYTYTPSSERLRTASDG